MNMATITKKELVDRIADKHKLPRNEVKQVVQDFLDEIVNELERNNRLEFRDFGTFECRQRAERIAQNPRTLNRVRVPSKRKVRFKAGRMLKARLVGPFSTPKKTAVVEAKKSIPPGQSVSSSFPSV
jgi:integration host factor subunit beta